MNHPKLRGLTQQQFILFHNFVSQEFRQGLLGTSPWIASWAYSRGMTQVSAHLPGLSSYGLKLFSSSAWTCPQEAAGLPGEEMQAAPCKTCALHVCRCYSRLILLVKVVHMACPDSRRWEAGFSSREWEELSWPQLAMVYPALPLFYLLRAPSQTPLLPHGGDLSHHASPPEQLRAPLVRHNFYFVLNCLLSCDTSSSPRAYPGLFEDREIRLEFREHFVLLGAHDGLSMCVCTEAKGGWRSRGWMESVMWPSGYDLDQ